MSVWLTIPSKRPPEEAEKVLREWRERGYKIALWVDDVRDGQAKTCDYWCASGYPGYASAVNLLIADIIGDGGPNSDTSAEWFIAAGDDTLPDPNHSAEQIAIECKLHFYDCVRQKPIDHGFVTGPDWLWTETFGVMQPTGDRWQDTERSRQIYGENRGALIDRVCGSAWIGREFARRTNGGRGPLWPEYTHCFVDEELQCVAEKYGVLWQRRDLVHKHLHWARGPEGDDNRLQNREVKMPEFLKEANSAEHWDKFLKLFKERKAAGFPGSELL